MKNFLVTLLLLLPGVALGQTQLAKWAISNIDAIDAERIELEIETGQKYFLTYGVVISSENEGFPVHGTCFIVSSGNAACELDLRNLTFVMVLGSTLNGTVKIRNSSDTVIDDGVVTLQQ